MDMPLKKALSPLIPLPVAANKRIAFATCLSKPDSTTDDAPLIAVLARAGYQAEAIPWDEPAAPWHHYAAVVIRSTWNYHTQKEKFKVWLKELERADIPVFNSITTLQWNMDKRYLSGLQAKGIPVPDLRFLEEGIPADVEEVFLTTHWKKAVIKPCVSATARNTWVTTPGQTGDTERLNGLLQEGSYIVQEFMEEILSDGEYSLIFFDNQYSHSVKKTSRRGDFRVQEEHGGSSVPVQPAPSIIRQAQHILDTAQSVIFGGDTQAGNFLYARVDGVIREGIFTLMELELIEPVLFFNNNKAAIEKFVTALLRKL